MQGLIQLYTGDGKGKSTAAFGLAIRAAGRGFNVAVLQFLKNRITGELISIEKLDNISVHRVNMSPKFTWDMNEEELAELYGESKRGLEHAKALAASGEYSVIILDEFIHTIVKGYVSKEDVLDFFATRPKNVELVLTGRNAPDWLIEAADLCTEMRCIKHPFEKGIPARKGIEN
jgi:cob(I)alamin adenosyltransferase